jgi:glycosyltransferase involved in cell wall biosynthesis
VTSRPDVLLDLSILGTETRVRGIGRYLLELAPALERQANAAGKLKLGFLERTDWLGSGAFDSSASAVIERLRARPEPEGRWSWAYRFRVGASHAVRSARVRLLHVAHPNVTPLGDTGPRVVTSHDLIPLRYPARYATLGEGFGPGRRLLDRRRHRRAQHIIAISRATADDLMNLLDIPASRITVVYNGVRLDAWSAEPTATDTTLRERYGLGQRFLIYAGDADWRKNADGMLRALAQARRESPKLELELAWAGKLSEARQQAIVGLASELGIADSVHLLGFVPDPDLAALYRQAHATLFVSRAEGFGYPVLEAMACGSPVITSNVSSLVEVAGDVATLVDPEDPSAIARAIVSVDEGASARRQRTSAGRDWVSRFSVERQAEETLAVYAQQLR